MKTLEFNYGSIDLKDFVALYNEGSRTDGRVWGGCLTRIDE
jgi:hypothetical protein